MSNLSKRIAALFIISFFMFSFSQVFSQENQQWDRFKQEKTDYFNEKLDMTEQEKEVFWPIYDDHYNRIMKFHEDERNLLNYYSINSEHLSGEEVDETIKKHFDIQRQRLELETQYHDKFVKAIGKKKTMTMYTLEREYRMHVLRKFRGGQGGQGGRGQNQGSGLGRNRAGGDK